MRSSSIPTSLVLLASAALCVGACGESQTEPGGSGAPTSTGTATGTMQAAAGTTGSTTTGAAGTPGSTGVTAIAGAPGSISSGTAGTAAAAAGGTATTTGAAGTSTTGAAGMAATGTAGAGTAGTSAAAAGMGAAGDASGAASGEPTFTRVFDEVLNAGCAAGAACHGNASGPAKLGFPDKMTAYMDLVDVKAMGMPLPSQMGTGCAGMDIVRVKAGDPASSLLMQKLEGMQTCGMQMPPGSMLKADQIQLVRDWIMAGAKND